MASLLDLSNEILLVIIEMLYGSHKNYVLVLREVCKLISTMAEPLAFQCIEFTQSDQGLSNLQHLSQTDLRFHVKQMVVSFEDYNAGISTDLATFVSWFRLRTIPLNSQKEMFERYQSGQRYPILLQRNNKDFEALAHTIRDFPNLQSIKMVQDWSSDWYQMLDTEEFNELALYPTGARVFEMVVFALATPTLTVKELILGDAHLENPPLLGIIQSLSPTTTSLYQAAFGQLQRLDVKLSWFESHFMQLNYEGLSNLLQVARLHELRLVMSPSSPIPPDTFLDVVASSPLRVLELDGVKFEDEFALIRLLYSLAPTLEVLRFHNVGIEHGSWEIVLFEMRNNLALKTCRLGKLLWAGNTIELGMCFGDRGIPRGAVDEFVQRESDINPFDLVRSFNLQLNNLMYDNVLHH